MPKKRRESMTPAAAGMSAKADTSYSDSLLRAMVHALTHLCGAQVHDFFSRHEIQPTTSPSAKASATHQMNFKNK
jgi:hypothetical protein